MKKILLFTIILLGLTSYGQTPNPIQRSYHRLYKLGNDLNTATTQFCQNTSGSLLKLNITNIPSPIPIGTVIFIDDNGDPETFGYYIVNFSRVSGNQDADETVPNSTVSIVSIDCANADFDGDGVPNSQDNCPNASNSNQSDIDNDGIGDVCDNQDNRDTDGDGVQNHQDNCPNEAGPASNQGCPGNADLIIDQNDSRVFSSCQSCNPRLDLFLSSGKRHLIASGSGSITFNVLEIRNIGNISSNSTKVDFWLSTNTTLDNNDKLLKSVNIPVRNSGSAYGVNTSINGWDLFDDHTWSGRNGNYFILANIDPSNTNNEGSTGEDNNLLAIPIRYNTNSTATSLRFNITSLESPSSSQPYIIHVFDINGQKILSRQVNDTHEENKHIQNLLKTGIYIIKSENSSRKVYVDKN